MMESFCGVDNDFSFVVTRRLKVWSYLGTFKNGSTYSLL
ncbi:hypothetical protein V6Z11_A05G100900 [Gossypium hirsutum]